MVSGIDASQITDALNTPISNDGLVIHDSLEIFLPRNAMSTDIVSPSIHLVSNIADIVVVSSIIDSLIISDSS